MDGLNKDFTSNPTSFLKKYAVACYNNQASARNDALIQAGINPREIQTFKKLAFDFQKNKMNYVDLKIMGDESVKTSTKDPYVIGNWITWLGGIGLVADIHKFGRIPIEGATSDYIFTDGLNGCHIAVVTYNTGCKTLYHEPTPDKGWSKGPNYTGKVERYGPKYGSGVFGGFAVASRVGNAWKLYVQSIKGVASSGVQEYKI